LLATAVSAFQAVRATRAERAAREQTVRALASEARANREAETAKAVKSFLTEQLLSANPYVQPAINPDHRRVLLEQVAQNIEGKFAQQPEVEDEIRFALLVGFVGVADSTNTLRQSERLLVLRRKRLGNTHDDTIEMMAYVAMNYMFLGEKAQAEKLLQEAAAHIPSSGALSRGAAVALWAHARLLRADHKLIEAMILYRRCLPDLIRTLGPTDERVINVIWDVAITAQNANLLDEADRLWTEGIRHFEQALSPDHPATAQFLKGKAYYLLERERGEWPEAMKLLERALPIYQRTFGTNHHVMLDAEDLLARAYEQKGETNTAAKIYQSTFPRWVKHFPYEGAGAFEHCDIIAKFFERNGSLSQAQLVRDEVKRFREKHPSANSARPDHSPP
jgi:tetratricopeptide (TPR) repeat protein